MKILSLNFKNLNSLEGEWKIDFTDPSYAANGVFLITGATGSGKTTILDAVCLALYGATPRLGRITKSANGIMSRQTGECFAEVIFETLQGRFICHFSQHRSQKKPHGKLQRPKHEISDADTGKILESKLKHVVLLVEKKTGMDFGRFTRSILLAQGDFAAFLNATADERAPILEQITGTEIYSAISIKVHERKILEQNRLNELESNLSGIKLLDKEDEYNFKLKLEEKKSREAELVKEQAELSKIISFTKELSRINLELPSLVETIKDRKEKIVKSDPALAKAEKEYLSSKTMRKESLVLIRQVREKDIHILEQKKNIDACKKTLEQLSMVDQDMKSMFCKGRFSDKAWFSGGKNRVLISIAPLFEILEQNTLKHQKVEDKIVDVEKKRDRIFKKFLNDEKEIKNAARVLSECEKKRDELKIKIAKTLKQNDLLQLREDREKLKERVNLIGHVAEMQSTVKKDIKRLNKGRTFMEEKEKENLKLAGIIKSCVNKRKIHEKEINHLEKEIKLLEKIQSLEQERSRLEPGAPCPLCGALEHPFAGSRIKKKTKEEQLLKQEKLKLEKIIEQTDGLKAELIKNQTAIATSIERIKELEQDVEINRLKIEKTMENFPPDIRWDAFNKEKTADMAAKLQLKIDKNEKIIKGVEKRERQLDKVLKDIETNQNAIKKLEKRLHKSTLAKAGVEHELKSLLKEKNSLEKEIKSNKKSLSQQIKEQIRLNNDSLDKLVVSLNAMQEKRRQLFSSKDPDREENIIDKMVEKSEKAFEGIRQENERIKHELFNNLEKKEELEGRIAELKEKLKDNREKDPEKKLGILNSQLRDLQQSLGSIKQQLRHNSEIKAKHKEKSRLIEQQKKECLRWDILHELIGSADGKKFRNFAQGLTFELMINHANRQLKDMTDRYLLIRDKNSPLELNVIDNYQAGEIRSTKNLSGGEGFIVSLALALGLSRMVSRNIKVDSLFLDEGFGTLDNDALETAMETLFSLHQVGKTIGLISHVPALRERIGVQIQVEAGTGGRSLIKGPGCSKAEV